jgi:hypothetical protein
LTTAGCAFLTTGAKDKCTSAGLCGTIFWALCAKAGLTRSARTTAVAKRSKIYLQQEPSRHMWTAPIGKRFLDALFDLVSFSHMYDLFVRPWPLVPMKLDCRGPNHCDGFDP